MTDKSSTSSENDGAFLAKMKRYTTSMNGVPIDRVSIHATDLLRLISMASSVHDSVDTGDTGDTPKKSDG